MINNLISDSISPMYSSPVPLRLIMLLLNQKTELPTGHLGLSGVKEEILGIEILLSIS